MPDTKTPIPIDQLTGRPCETCKARVAPSGGIYGPPHSASQKGHANHCSCDGCY